MNRLLTLVGAALVALVVVGAAVFGALGFRPTNTQAAQIGQQFTRSITVVGNGTVKAEPDMATVQLGVQSQAATAQQALADNSTNMNAIKGKLTSLGIADKDLQTSNFSISPVYDTNGRAVTGYQVTNMLTVKIHKVGEASSLLDKVVEAGANSIYGINFGFEDPNKLQADARTNAIADARSRAEAMAKTSGATLGQVLTINENVGATPPMPMPMARDAAMVEGGAAPVIQAGQQEVSSQVQITFELR